MLNFFLIMIPYHHTNFQKNTSVLIFRFLIGLGWTQKWGQITEWLIKRFFLKVPYIQNFQNFVNINPVYNNF